MSETCRPAAKDLVVVADGVLLLLLLLCVFCCAAGLAWAALMLSALRLVLLCAMLQVCVLVPGGTHV